MKIYIKNHKFRYEIENLCRLFFPNEKLIVCDDNVEMSDNIIYTELVDANECKILRTFVRLNEQYRENCVDISLETDNLDLTCELEFSKMLFNILCDLTSIRPPWGILTGIRPIKLLRNVIKEKGYDQAKVYFKNNFLVSDDKLNLALETMKREEPILQLSKNNSFSLYVSIPFCPSRCSYCSFVSQSVEKAAKLIPDYVRLLCIELEHTAKVSKDLGLKLETVYIGGGTPTTLSSDYLFQIVDTINKNFDLSTLREFTVEAGRPDTITKDKLLTIKHMGIDRISINPQTLNDNIIQSVGRNHSAKDVIDSFNLARQIGFNSINMDLIVGLPGEDLESFCNSLDRVCELNPQNITIHTLCMKKASHLSEQCIVFNTDEEKTAAKMMDYAQYKLYKYRYFPYYLYRQSRMIANLENIGWAEKDKECLYNIYVMDETHTILSCGAGAVTKLRDPNSNYLKRIFNFKFPYEYISGFKEIINRKDGVKEFYDELQ